MFKAAILTISDKGSKGEREDLSGKVIKEILLENKYQVAIYEIIPDEQSTIENKLIEFADKYQVDLILTTGGTGFSKRDVTPEATIKVATKLVPGISEAIRQFSLQITKRAMLSRAASVIRNNTLIINLPGSPKAVRESLEYIITELDHGLNILKGKDSECAR
ncbi:molybdopterin adenylyltransferase [Miniphocaeibacter halophilus]|uniref:Molybdopterin adenylyltransferase n=1 Tax=Miniphocaeibacter halophilus TaxID=2931922 RepID=A0AC61MP67_9FIRM|nr:molybdopterin adenylyltransferase [Miniphocaeibacter halophilus]QQK07315.1 molybdopterin adenylyltransferase [Miniphocaeibacter halophilus]